MLYKETVTPQMWELLQRLMKDEKLKEFNLVGGTALSLIIGHRLSIDIDLFSTQDFDIQDMLAHLRSEHPVTIRELFENTMLLNIGKVKVDILTHKYPWQEPIKTEQGIRLVSLQDIGAMKLHAIFQNGTRIKDFVDMYFLLEHHPLKIYLDAYQNKYKGSPGLALISLLHHKNIDREEKVKLLKGKETSWTKICQRLKKAVLNPSFDFSKPKNQIPPPSKRRGFRR
ncbi:nucleotidyl transferase AbiEii/AbiGii toxin family protein [Flavobacterium sp. YJ01]|uniref:nucleotidyl transferase AbiEii/AbiGii toxin family protein n=1 Tax=Flavobacterium sp. YJ01 TaxID=3031997 RepID=UPI0023E388E8|nr:nucleotidyl transferase AbiEii/AbiGii toxin family protein [Flavobacterium sp. YJ01]WET02717.1 nucleotidyl transferase AbiEii/AbiGii toxin family protein [Flavobacterium sp. YJ01]